MNVFFLRKYPIKIINKRLNPKRSAAYLSIIFAIRQVAFLIFPAPVRIRHTLLRDTRYYVDPSIATAVLGIH